ncbi:putative Pectinesterase inhibitor [Quillaja saponaria]|uniref:Pectinesterase inhibitor n=1 Tax=Quillaja saponaria TaxID=32244 RepID=A0AAD7Q1A1_QUISA|nr:putative Pectinesterase inhibitor [Quillaja saponaria]
MKPISTIFFFPFVICFSFVPSQISATRLVATKTTTNGIDLIQNICQQAHAKDICINGLRSDPNSLTADLKGLALIAIRVAASNATDTSEHLKLLLNDDSMDPAVQQGLTDCMDSYIDASQQLDDSVVSLLENSNQVDVRAWLLAAVAAADTCEDSLKGNEKLLQQKNLVFRRFCNIALLVNRALTTGA